MKQENSRSLFLDKQGGYNNNFPCGLPGEWSINTAQVTRGLRISYMFNILSLLITMEKKKKELDHLIRLHPLRNKKTTAGMRREQKSHGRY